MLKRVLPMIVAMLFMNSVAYANTAYTSLQDVEATGLNIELLDEICGDDVEKKATFLAIIEHESGFSSSAIHLNEDGTRDYGYGQINDVTFEFLSEELGISEMGDLLDGDTNILAMEALIDYHLDATGNLADAILRYQVGNGNYTKLRRRGITTTKTHQNVLSLQEKYIDILNEA